jgi:hypothetical protein
MVPRVPVLDIESIMVQECDGAVSDHIVAEITYNNRESQKVRFSDAIYMTIRNCTKSIWTAKDRPK